MEILEIGGFESVTLRIARLDLHRLFRLGFAGGLLMARLCLPKLLLGCLLAAIAAGCAPAVEHVTEATVKPAVGSGLEELTEEENKQRVNELLELEGVEAAGESMGRGLTMGSLSALVGLQDELEAIDLEGRTGAAFELMAKHVDDDLRPVLQQLAASMTQAVLDVVGSPENRQQAQLLAAAVTDAVMEAIADGLRGEMGPAVQEMLVDHVGPGIQQMLDDDFNEALGETARVVSRKVAVGAAEGLREAGVVQPDEPTLVELFAQRVVDLGDALGWMFWVLVLVFFALFVVFVGWAARLMFQARDVKKKSDLRDETVVRLAEAIRRVEHNGENERELLREVEREMDELDRD